MVTSLGCAELHSACKPNDRVEIHRASFWMRELIEAKFGNFLPRQGLGEE